MTVNFNFFQKDKIMNVVLHVFLSKQKTGMLSDLGLSDQKTTVFKNR